MIRTITSTSYDKDSNLVITIDKPIPETPDMVSLHGLIISDINSKNGTVDIYGNEVAALNQSKFILDKAHNDLDSKYDFYREAKLKLVNLEKIDDNSFIIKYSQSIDI